MKHTSRSARFLAIVAGTALIAAACGDDDDDGGAAETTAATEETGAETTAATEETTADTGTETSAEGGEGAMTISFTIRDEAVWEDGTPITVADVQCTWEANVNTVGTYYTYGHEKITSIEQGETEKDVVIEMSEVFAPYKATLFVGGILKKAAVEEAGAQCSDVSSVFQDNVPFSGRPWKLESWSTEQAILVPNEAYWNAEKMPKAERVVLVPKADSDTEINSLKSAESDFIFPQAYSGINEALADPNIEFEPGYGLNYEGLWFNAQSGPLADPTFRKAFSMSVDRQLILDNIYGPIFPGGELLSCGPVTVPTIGEWCDNTIWAESYNLEEAASLLEAEGWTKNADGLWEKDGTVPTIRWIINQGNKRREDTQALMIPVLREAGFDVVQDNTDAATYFQKRLPALDYDLAMYIQVAAPDPSATSIMACDQIPTEENDFAGVNYSGYCSEEVDDLMVQADQELDEAARLDLTKQYQQIMFEDAAWLPLYQFPNIAAYRTDKLSGPVTAEAANYRAFANNLYAWEPVGDTDIIIGAEQWPECINPITECASSSWMVWTTIFNVLPGIWDSTADGAFVPTDLVTAEPEVTTS